MRRAAVAWAAAIVISCGLLALPLVAYAATSAVTIQGSAFNPPTTPVRVGDTVRWTNADGVPHTSTSDTGLWDSGVLSTGGSFSFTFGSAGTFAYHCTIHPFMTGTVVVQAASTPQPTAPPAPPTQQPTPPPTPLPTPVRTAAPTAAPTAPPTAAPTAAPTEPPATPTPSASPSPTASAVETLTVSASPSAVAVQLTSAPAASGGGPAPLLIAAAAIAVVALGAIAFTLMRRS